MTGDNQLHVGIPFGFKAGRILAPADVESGLACDCRCLQCNGLLIAKKGTKRVWHFAHHNVIATQSCIETAIHAAAKQVLLDANWINLPEKRITVSGRTKSGATHTKSKLLLEPRTVRFEYCRDEVWETNIRPDVIGYRGNRRLLVEMFFTHRVDEAKRHKLEELNLPSIEIDLSNLKHDADFEAVSQRVLHDVTEKEWLFYPREKQEQAALRNVLEQEIAQLDLKHERQLSNQKRKQEARQREIDKKIKNIADANERYRALPRLEKECLLRESLNITGVWPYYLNKASEQANAVNELPRIWQAALFSRFIYGKGTAGQRLQVDTIQEWVIDRFGVIDNRRYDAQTAVKQFLGYLRACGFIAKSPYNPYEDTYYEVVHDALTPPSRKYPKEDMRGAAPSPIVVNSASFSSPAKVHSTSTRWLWRASWPSRADMLGAAGIHIEHSPHKELLRHAIEALSPQSRPHNPLDAAIQLESKGVPRDVTLDFFVSLGLVLKPPRSP